MILRSFEQDVQMSASMDRTTYMDVGSVDYAGAIICRHVCATLINHEAARVSKGHDIWGEDFLVAF